LSTPYLADAADRPVIYRDGDRNGAGFVDRVPCVLAETPQPSIEQSTKCV
jgi:hypothetical protein